MVNVVTNIIAKLVLNVAANWGNFSDFWILGWRYKRKSFRKGQRMKAYTKLNKDYAYELKRFERNVQKMRYANSPSEKARYFDKLITIKNSLVTYLECGANPNTEIRAGFTGLHFFAEIADVKLVEKVLEGANPNAIAHKDYNSTPIHYASGMQLCLVRQSEDFGAATLLQTNNAYIKTIELLIKFGANINAIDKTKSTALHEAAFFENVDVVKALLKANAEYEILNSKGNTPLIIAYLKKNQQVLKHLLHNGASPDNSGKNVLSPAQECRN